MSCEKIQQDILLSQSGELTERELVLLGEHLTGCESCRRYKAGLEQVTSLVRTALPAGEPSPAVMARILSAAREEVHGNSIFFPAPSLRKALYAAAALFTVCAAGLWSFDIRPLSSASQMSAIVMAVGSEAELKVISRSGKPEKDQEIQALASHLLLMEGFVADELPDVELIDAADEPRPTALQLHNTDAIELKRCV